MVIGLSFMIAIIDSTYQDLTKEKEDYQYRNKSEMNLESFEIL